MSSSSSGLHQSMRKSHKSYWSPAIENRLFFTSLTTTPPLFICLFGSIPPPNWSDVRPSLSSVDRLAVLAAPALTLRERESESERERASAKAVNLCNGFSIFIPQGAKGNIKHNRHILTVRQAGRQAGRRAAFPHRAEPQLGFSMLEYAKTEGERERERWSWDVKFSLKMLLKCWWHGRACAHAHVCVHGPCPQGGRWSGERISMFKRKTPIVRLVAATNCRRFSLRHKKYPVTSCW